MDFVVEISSPASLLRVSRLLPYMFHNNATNRFALTLNETSPLHAIAMIVQQAANQQQGLEPIANPSLHNLKAFLLIARLVLDIGTNNQATLAALLHIMYLFVQQATDWTPLPITAFGFSQFVTNTTCQHALVSMLPIAQPQHCDLQHAYVSTKEIVGLVMLLDHFGPQ